MFWVLYCFFAVLLLITGTLAVLISKKELPLKPNTRCLLLIAHPDDECMFFAPTVVRLIRRNCKVSVLCVTTGNADGLGHLRKKELRLSCERLGVSPSRVSWMDINGLADGQVKWETERLSRIVLQHIERLDTEVVVTFDNRGVSNHPNHISCFSAVQFLYSNGWMPPDVQVFILESVSLLRKYSGVLDLVATYFTSNFVFVSAPWLTWRAMREHQTQMAWFRYLYLLFSRYTCINSLKRIALHPFLLKSGKKK